jgi:aspartate-semialdehyde dehydrogenase
MRGYRVGVVGPRSPFGQGVRALLGEGELPVMDLKLFESELAGQATLTQFGDDVVVTQPLDPDLFPHLDVVFVSGEESDALNRCAREAAEAGSLALVEGAVGLDGPVVTPDSIDTFRSGHSARDRLLIVPRAASHLIGASLRPLVEPYRIERAVATVLVPAQDQGDPGASELHQQIVHILNFKTPPTEVFHEQLAFNVTLAGSGPDGGGVAESVALEASQIAALEGALTATLVQVPVFHGYAAAIWVELGAHAESKELRARYRDALYESPRSGRAGRPPSPVAVAGSAKVHIGPIRKGRANGPPGFWLWAVADTTSYDPASAAIRIARELL